MKLWRQIPEFGRSLKYGTTFPTRLTLALATTITAASMSVDPRFLTGAQYGSFLVVMPPWSWALCFVAVAALQWWRIFDTRPRGLLATVVNSSTFGLWTTFTVCSCMNAGGVVPVDTAGEIALTLAAGWVAIRTEITKRDRETA